MIVSCAVLVKILSVHSSMAHFSYVQKWLSVIMALLDWWVEAVKQKVQYNSVSMVPWVQSHHLGDSQKQELFAKCLAMMNMV